MVECPLCGRNFPFSKLRIALLSGCLNYPIGDEPRSRQLTGWLPHEQNDWKKRCLRDLWSPEAIEIRQTPLPVAVVPPVVAVARPASGRLPPPPPAPAAPVVENECTICTEPFTDNNPQVCLPCAVNRGSISRHCVMCKACLDILIRRSIAAAQGANPILRCPTCRAEFSALKVRDALDGGCLKYPLDNGRFARVYNLIGWPPHERNQWKKRCLGDLSSRQTRQIQDAAMLQRMEERGQMIDSDDAPLVGVGPPPLGAGALPPLGGGALPPLGVQRNPWQQPAGVLLPLQGPRPLPGNRIVVTPVDYHDTLSQIVLQGHPGHMAKYTYALLTSIINDNIDTECIKHPTIWSRNVAPWS